jgi:micrococcal nuclease
LNEINPRHGAACVGASRIAVSFRFVLVMVLGACGAAPRTDPGVPAVVTPAATATAATPVDATPRPTGTSPAIPTLAPLSAQVPTFGPTGKTTEASVVRVVDGDTIVVAYGGEQYKVRYIGMNTPETVDPSSPIEFMGPEASAANKVLVAGKTVVLEKDVSETDRYDRLLRYVWLTDGADWTLVNLELIKEGFASVSTFPPDVKYVDVYLAAERDAQATAVGLWGEAPIAEPTPDATARPIANTTKCHPWYTPCLPIVADLNCPDVRAMGKAPVTVKGPDDYRLDRDGDGIGCE